LSSSAPARQATPRAVRANTTTSRGCGLTPPKTRRYAMGCFLLEHRGAPLVSIASSSLPLMRKAERADHLDVRPQALHEREKRLVNGYGFLIQTAILAHFLSGGQLSRIPPENRTFLRIP